jgi:hypothetical protein
VAVVLKKSKEIVTEPLDVGEGKLSLVDVIAQAEGAPVSAGICEIWASAPVEFDYDNDCAVCYMLEGSVTLTRGWHPARLRVRGCGLRPPAGRPHGLLGHAFVREVLLRDLPTLAVGRPGAHTRSTGHAIIRSPAHALRFLTS